MFIALITNPNLRLSSGLFMWEINVTDLPDLIFSRFFAYNCTVLGEGDRVYGGVGVNLGNSSEI